MVGGETVPNKHCQHLSDFCIMMGSDENHLMSISYEEQSHKTVSINHNFLKERAKVGNRTDIIHLLA